MPLISTFSPKMINYTIQLPKCRQIASIQAREAFNSLFTSKHTNNNTQIGKIRENREKIKKILKKNLRKNKNKKNLR